MGVAAFATIAGLLHGLVNGATMMPGGASPLAVAGAVTAVFCLLSIVSAEVTTLRVGWTRIAVRVAGSWIAAAGLLMLGWLARRGVGGSLRSPVSLPSMYASFFGLKHEPFSIAPDPRYLFMSERHREALAHLLYGVKGAGGGFVLLTGEIGAGKTTVCRCLLEQIPKRCTVAYIFNPKLTALELLKTVCDEFHVPYKHERAGHPTVKDYLDPLNEYLLKTHAIGLNNVLIIDEAQNLSAGVLEQLRLLTNLETNQRKLLQIVLIGQPELRGMLARPELEQLAQRVIARYHLGALTESETAQYLRHRLGVAGLATANPFSKRAMRRIHQRSRGVPRRINLLADRALLGAYADGVARVDHDIVDKAAAEVLDAADSPPVRRARFSAGPWWASGWSPRRAAWQA